MKTIFKVGLWIVFIMNMVEGNAQTRDNLQKVRKEIQQLEADLRAKENEEGSLIEQVEDMDREIGLRQTLLDELEVERKEKERKIQETSILLQKAKEGYLKQKAVVAQRMVSLYKRGRSADWEALFSVSSLSQAAVWLKYQKRIVENDQRNLQQLLEKAAEIQSTQRQLDKELEEKEEVIREKRVETEKLGKKKSSREKLLVLVQKDKKSIQEQLQRKRMAFREIEGRINQEEQKRQALAEKTDGSRFAAQKGKLIWPVKGKIVSKYGRNMHPVLKTWTENLGIDIEAAEGADIRSVNMGKIVWVGWLRGMRNMVLVDHGGGYYTVYGHLDEVFVNTGETVGDAQIIGRIGDRRSLDGSTLHFQIWNGMTHFDPETWLR